MNGGLTRVTARVERDRPLEGDVFVPPVPTMALSDGRLGMYPQRS